MLLLDLSNCGASWILRVVYFFKLIIGIVFAVIPVVLIIFLMVDFMRMVINKDESEQKKIFNLAMKRLMYAILVFCVPSIISIVNTLLGNLGVNYSACYNDITIEAIEQLENEETAKREALAAARAAEIAKKSEEEREERERQDYQNSNETYVSNGSGCDGAVYYSDGVFFRPRVVNSSVNTKGTGYDNYNKYFYEMLNNFLSAAKRAGYDIKPGDGWRSVKDQEYYYCCYQKSLKKSGYEDCDGDGKNESSCNNGNNARAPGESDHEFGIASDLQYPANNRAAAVKWAHENAAKYHLRFSVSSEDWHIIPDSITYDDNIVEEKCK